MNKVEHQNEHFDRISERYYQARQGKNHLLFKHVLFENMLSDLAQHVDKTKKLAVLEPMCGYGEGRDIVEKYITNNYEYEGFDFNDTLIDKEKRRNPHVKIYKQDVTTWTPQSKYDIIILIGGLHHVPDFSETVVRTIFDSLNEGGVFINFEPTHNIIFVGLIRTVVYKLNSLFDNQTERGFSLRYLNQLYKTAGFRKYRQYYPGLLGYILYYNPDAFPLLNFGNGGFVKGLFNKEKKLYGTKIAKALSFCTFSILLK